MSLKLKALTLGMLATVAVGAFGVLSATAETGGHFSSDASGGWTNLHATQIGAAGTNEFWDNGLETGVTCETAEGQGSTANATEASVTINKLAFANCHPTIGGSATVHMNECDFVAKMGKNPTTQDQTVDLVCPTGKEVTLTVDPPIVGTCTIHIPPQTSKGGAKYHTGLTTGKHDLTVTINTKEVTNTKTESGFGCFGTAGENVESELKASLTVWGTDTEGNKVNITATGPSGEEA